MSAAEYEGGTGGKFSKRRPLRRVASTPYDRPAAADHRIHGTLPETGAGGRRWFSKFVDPASRVIVRSASRVLSVFGKGLAAPSGKNISTIEEVPEVKSSLEVREQGRNPSDLRPSIHCDGSDRSGQEIISHTNGIFELEKLLKQKRLPRDDIDRLTELLHSRAIEPPTLLSTDYKNKGKINEDTSINSSSSSISSQQAVSHLEKEKENPSKLEGQREPLINLHGNSTSGVHVNIPEDGFVSPIEIARAYMGSKPQKAAPSTLQSKICQRDKASPLNLHFGNKLSNAASASRSAVCFPVIPGDSGNDCMTQKSRGRSALYKLPRSPYYRSFMMTNHREYSPYKKNNVEPTRSLEWPPSLSNIRHSGHGQALKHGSSDRDAGCFSDARRVRQKSCLKDLNLSAHADTSPTFLFGQENEGIDLKGLDNVDGRIPSTSVLHVPLQSVEMAKKILYQLDKLSPSPQNKSFEKKVIVGDASFSMSSLSASHAGSLKTKANNDSTKLPNVQGSRILEDPSSSNLAIITSSVSPNKDMAEGEASSMPYISRAEVASCLGMSSSVASGSFANHSMKSMDSNSHVFALLLMQKESTIQSAPDDKVEPTKSEHAIYASVKEPRQKPFLHSLEYQPTSGFLHTDSDTKASAKGSDKSYTEKNVSSNFLAARTFNTLSKQLLSSTMTTTLADGATPMKEDTVSPLKFGSQVSTYNATKSTSTGISARLNAGSLSAVSSSTGAPKFQFGSGNSTSYSFTGVSAVSSSTGIGVCTPVLSSLYPPSEGSGSLLISAVFPLSANGVLGVSTSSTSGGSSLQFLSSSSQNTALNFGAVAASSFGTEGISSGIGVAKFSHNSVCQFGALDSQATSGLGSSSQASCSSQIGFTISGVKPFTLSSCIAASSGASLSSSNNSSLSLAAPASFSTSSTPFFLPSSFSATLGSTPLSPPSTGFSFGMPANASGSVPFLSSSRLPLSSTGTTTSVASLSSAQPVFGLPTYTTCFGSGSPSNDQVIVQNSRAGSNLQAVPMAPPLDQPAILQLVPSQAQVLQFGSYKNNSGP